MTFKKRLDLMDEQFEKLTVIEYAGKIKNRTHWKCKCECGAEIVVSTSNLRTGHTTSCGCSRRSNMLNRRFERLLVVSYEGMDNRQKHGLWKCECDCGQTLVVRGDSLLSGATKSCGCLLAENRAQFGLSLTKHGLSHTREFKRFLSIWSHMISRCTNKKDIYFHHYGGRGIYVSENWLEFKQFREDLYESFLDHARDHGLRNTTIDRKDNDGGYSKENCRWATRKVQMNNTRQQRSFIAINKQTGEQIIAKGYVLFAESVGIRPDHISAVLSGKRKSTYGYKFKNIENGG